LQIITDNRVDLFQVRYDPAFQRLLLVGNVDDPEYITQVRAFEALFDQLHAVGRDWACPSLERCPEDPPAPLGDCPLLFHGALLFSERAMIILRETLKDGGEWLRLPWNEGTLHAYHVMFMLDVVDPIRSTIDRRTTGRWGNIDRLVLKENPLALPPVFRIPQIAGCLIATSEFESRWRGGGLHGLLFRKLT